MKRLAVAAALACAGLLAACASEAPPLAPAPAPAAAASPSTIPIAAAPTAPVDVTPVPLPKPAATAEPVPAPSSSDADEAACKVKGGTIQPVGLAGRPACVIPYKDAGKSCTDGDECEGDCWTGSAAPGPDGKFHGKCQETNMPFGCHGRVEDGKLAGGIMCVD